MTMPASLAQILREFLSLAQLRQAADDIVNGAPFRVGSQEFTLQCGAGGDGDQIVVQGSLGMPPIGHETETYELLLRSNALLAGNFGPIFGMQPDNSGLLMVLALPVGTLTASRLHDALMRMAEAAKVWRDTRGFSASTGGQAATRAKHAPLSTAFGTPRMN